MRKALIGGAAAFATVALAATACGSSSSDGTGGSVDNSVAQTVQIYKEYANVNLAKLSPSIKDPSSPTTITFQTWQTPNTGAKALLLLAAQFHQIHPNITVKFQSVPAEQAQTKLTAQIAGGNPPDVAYMDTGTVGAFAPRGALVNLEPYIAKSKGAVRKDYVPVFRSMVSYQDQMYGLPIDGESTALFYNTKLFKQAGITHPPKTWAEEQADAAKINDPAKKISGFALFATQGETSYYWYPFLYQAGGSQTNADGQRRGVCEPRGHQGRELLHRHEQVLRSQPVGVELVGCPRELRQRQDRHVHGRSVVRGRDDLRTSRRRPATWASAPLPTETAGSPCATTIAGDALVIPSGSHNQDAAWKWIEFLSAPRNMALLDLGTKKYPVSLLPTRTSMLNNPTTFTVNPGLKGFADGMKCGILNLSENKNWGEVDAGPLSTALAQAIYSKKTAQQALQRFAAAGKPDARERALRNIARQQHRTHPPVPPLSGRHRHVAAHEADAAVAVAAEPVERRTRKRKKKRLQAHAARSGRHT